MRTYFDALKVERGCTVADVVKSYRSLAKIMHPDIAPARANEFTLVTAAFNAMKQSGDDGIWAYARRARTETLSRSEWSWSREYTMLVDGTDIGNYRDPLRDFMSDFFRQERRHEQPRTRQQYNAGASYGGRKAKGARCGEHTASGPCCRPFAHPHGHMSQEVYDRKKANAKARRSY